MWLERHFSYFSILFFLHSSVCFQQPWPGSYGAEFGGGVTNSFLGTIRHQARKIDFLERQSGFFDRFTAGFIFKRFTYLFKRPYVSDGAEYKKRKSIFIRSLRRQAELNRVEENNRYGARYGVNKFSDWSEEEFKALLGSKPLSKDLQEILKSSGVIPSQALKGETPTDCSFDDVAPPKKFDWRKLGKITAVQNQGQCGSCWAFVAAQQTEAFWAIHRKENVENLSVQEFLSCSPSRGCNGGSACQALAWLSYAVHRKKKYRLVKASEYPYEIRKSPCQYDRTSQTGAKISGLCGCHNMYNEEKTMLKMLAQRGPIGVNVDAVSWQDYISGVIQRHCTNQTINHAVQIVGYDVSNPLQYWIVRNTWGLDFGENGYLRIKIGGNICGVEEEPSIIRV